MIYTIARKKKRKITLVMVLKRETRVRALLFQHQLEQNSQSIENSSINPKAKVVNDHRYGSIAVN